PKGPARRRQVGLVEVGIGDVGRGLCGGMAFVAADRFTRGEAAPAEDAPPPFGDSLFREVVDRQLDSFGRLFSVPLRFALAAFASDRQRRRDSVRLAWPAIRREIDGGRLAMVGLVRRSGFALTAPDFGHQVVAYRYEASAERVTIGVYDPNHPGDDTVELVLERSPEGEISLAQSTGEPLLGLLALPWVAAER
ncbi:MAG: hypothetical protein ABUL57_03460, partial [Chloroflexota bacterium]